MRTRQSAAVLLLAWFLLPLGAHAQLVEEENSETVQYSSAGKLKRTEKPDLARVAESITQQTNELRGEKDLQKVETNAHLSAAAGYFADYLASTNEFSHTADGSRPSERAAEHGYEYCIISENIAYQYGSTRFSVEELAERFVEVWIHSPQHRQNMLDPDMAETGVAVAHSQETGHYYAVQMFGRPRWMSIEFQVTNQTDAVVEYQVGDQWMSLPPRYTRSHQRCRPAELTFDLADPDEEDAAEDTSKTVKPSSGDRFVVVNERGKLQVRKAE